MGDARRRALEDGAHLDEALVLEVGEGRVRSLGHAATGYDSRLLQGKDILGRDVFAYSGFQLLN